MFTILYYGSLIIIIPGVIFAFIAQILVSVYFKKYSKIGASNGITADEASRRLLRDHGCFGVSVQPVSGNLTDNYNPSTDILSLSEGVFGSSSVAAIGVAAHECGHACQKYDGSFLMKLRSFLVPVANIGSRLAVPVAVIGLIIELLIGGTSNNVGTYILASGIFLYSLTTIFALVTLPVEIDASRRAMKMIKEDDILDRSEQKGARKVLTAAALTYVASLVVSFLYLLRFILIIASVRGKRND